MAETPEKKVKNRIKKVLEELGCYYVMPIGSGYGALTGCPDFLICLQGHFMGIEAKAGKNKPTALQLRHLEKIQAAGGLALIVNEENVDDLKTLLLKQMENEWIY